MPPTILIIEDTGDILENLIEILRLQNYDVLAAIDGVSGIQLAKQNKPDLILCDILMPGLNGYDVIRLLKETHETRHIPLLFITSQIDDESIQRAHGLGAAGHIVKPFDGNLLIRKVEHLLAIHVPHDKDLCPGRSIS